jgi:hypothetical protein
MHAVVQCPVCRSHIARTKHSGGKSKRHTATIADGSSAQQAARPFALLSGHVLCDHAIRGGRDTAIRCEILLSACHCGVGGCIMWWRRHGERRERNDAPKRRCIGGLTARERKGSPSGRHASASMPFGPTHPYAHARTHAHTLTHTTPCSSHLMQVVTPATAAARNDPDPAAAAAADGDAEDRRRTRHQVRASLLSERERNALLVVGVCIGIFISGARVLRRNSPAAPAPLAARACCCPIPPHVYACTLSTAVRRVLCCVTRSDRREPPSRGLGELTWRVLRGCNPELCRSCGNPMESDTFCAECIGGARPPRSAALRVGTAPVGVQRSGAASVGREAAHVPQWHPRVRARGRG